MKIPGIKFYDGLIWRAELLEAINALRVEGRLNEVAYEKFLKHKKQTNLGFYLMMAFFFVVFTRKPLLGLGLLAGGALILYLSNIRGMDGAALLHITGVRTEGEIVKARKTFFPTEARRHWEIQCAYKDSKGKVYTKFLPENKNLGVKEIANWTPYEGEKVQIVYNSRKPKHADLILPPEYNIYDLIKKEETHD